jgi:CreA protein
MISKLILRKALRGSPRPLDFHAFATIFLPSEDQMKKLAAALLACMSLALPAVAQQSDDPELIFKKTTVWRLLSPDAKLATYAIDDPGVGGVACYFTVPEIGGWKGWAGFAEEVSDVSIACRQVGPVVIKEKFEQGHEIYRQRRSLFFKKMQIVRGCDAKHNVLVYLSYTDKLIEGSPKNSTSSVPIMPWGDAPAPKCGEFIK